MGKASCLLRKDADFSTRGHSSSLAHYGVSMPVFGSLAYSRREGNGEN
jgi:hypothetical protein